MSEGGMRVMEVDDFDGVAGKDWTEFWEGPGKVEAQVAVKAALAGGIGRFAGSACTMKGTLKWWDVQVTPIRDGDGTVSRLLAVSRDVTAAHKVEEELAASEARYRDLYDGIDAGFCVIEVKVDADERPLDYRFLEVNPAFERQSGLGRRHRHGHRAGRRRTDLRAVLHDQGRRTWHGPRPVPGDRLRQAVGRRGAGPQRAR